MFYTVMIRAVCFLSLCAVCLGAENDQERIPPIFCSPPDNWPDGYGEKDMIREQKELVGNYAREQGLSTNQVVQLICDILSRRLDKTPKTKRDQEIIGLAGDALRLLDIRSATNLLEKTVFAKDIEGRSCAILCYFSVAREDGIDAAYRMLAKPEVIDGDARFAIFTYGMVPLLESKDDKIRKAAAAVLKHAAKSENVEDNATHIDGYLIKADPTWEKDETRKRLAERFVRKGPILPYFREVQQKIGKPTAEAEGK